ncbi:lectin C-type domain protein [Teladorsagia circumcincta]|uniref:Lectin C-type domain protein n=1 Tax=Teladorsagia circumcincta TaxID=45464 RepID=A0A2G9TYQ3_TELCI|nr:lectin C-type domain protein [Teladorsagia circumcincta]
MFTLLLLVLPVVVAICPQGTIYRQEFERVKKSYSLAETDCLSLGGHLVSIQNGYENAMLIETAQADHFPLPFYIGLNSIEGGLWTWTDGTPTTYTNWAHGISQFLIGRCLLGGVTKLISSQFVEVIELHM